MEALTNFINGLSLGSVYAIIALGYTMVYGIAKMLNFAHGDVIMVGAYICFCSVSYLGLHPLLGVLLSGAESGSEVEAVLLEHPARTEAIRVSARALEINFFIAIISFGVQIVFCGVLRFRPEPRRCAADRGGPSQPRPP